MSKNKLCRRFIEKTTLRCVLRDGHAGECAPATFICSCAACEASRDPRSRPVDSSLLRDWRKPQVTKD